MGDQQQIRSGWQSSLIRLIIRVPRDAVFMSAGLRLAACVFFPMRVQAAARGKRRHEIYWNDPKDLRSGNDVEAAYS